MIHRKKWEYFHRPKLLLFFFVNGVHFRTSHIIFVQLSYNNMKHPASQAEQRIGALAADEPQEWFKCEEKRPQRG
jgi:hypothetical protein